MQSHFLIFSVQKYQLMGKNCDAVLRQPAVAVDVQTGKLRFAEDLEAFIMELQEQPTNMENHVATAI